MILCFHKWAFKLLVGHRGVFLFSVRDFTLIHYEFITTWIFTKYFYFIIIFDLSVVKVIISAVDYLDEIL